MKKAKIIKALISELEDIPKELQDKFIQKYYVKVKSRVSFSHHTMFTMDVEPPAKKEGKIPVLITHKKSSKSGALVILRMDDFLDLIKNNEP